MKHFRPYHFPPLTQVVALVRSQINAYVAAH